MKISFIDHYDSFSLNVVDWLIAANPDLQIEQIYYDDYEKMHNLCITPTPLVLSPGPKSPQDALSTLEIIRTLWRKVPMFGVCLGHQLLAYAQGASIVRCKNPVHGEKKVIKILEHNSIFSGLPAIITQAVYNSLCVERSSPWEKKCRILAVNEDDEIQALEFFSAAPTYGVQFHPESFLSADFGAVIAKNWLRLVQEF